MKQEGITTNSLLEDSIDQVPKPEVGGKNYRQQFFNEYRYKNSQQDTVKQNGKNPQEIPTL